MQLSPIVLFVYNRPSHTRLTLEALMKNYLAPDSELFIFSDGPKNEKDIKKVKEVRQYINSIKGFKRIKIVEKLKNIGLAHSVIDGVSEILNYHNKIIVLEDDMISSFDFLTYMNNALEFYSNHLDIFSISGYNFPLIIPTSYLFDVYLSYRPSSWGWGTWKDKWEKNNWNKLDYSDFISNHEQQEEFNKGGNDLSDLLKLKIKGKIHSWAIDWAYYHFINKSYCLYPKISKIINIGLDGSGTNIRLKTRKFTPQLGEAINETIFYKDIPLNDEILKNFYNCNKIDFIHKLYNRVRLIL